MALLDRIREKLRAGLDRANNSRAWRSAPVQRVANTIVNLGNRAEAINSRVASSAPGQFLANTGVGALKFFEGTGNWIQAQKYSPVIMPGIGIQRAMQGRQVFSAQPVRQNIVTPFTQKAIESSTPNATQFARKAATAGRFVGEQVAPMYVGAVLGKAMGTLPALSKFGKFAPAARIVSRELGQGLGFGTSSAMAQGKSVKDVGKDAASFAAQNVLMTPANLIPNVGRTKILRALPRAFAGAVSGAGTAKIFGQDMATGAALGVLAGPVGEGGSRTLVKLNVPKSTQFVAIEDVVPSSQKFSRTRVEKYKKQILSGDAGKAGEPLSVVREKSTGNLVVQPQKGVSGDDIFQAYKELGFSRLPIKPVRSGVSLYSDVTGLGGTFRKLDEKFQGSVPNENVPKKLAEKPYVLPATNSADVTKLSEKDLKYFTDNGFTSITDRYGNTRKLNPADAEISSAIKPHSNANPNAPTIRRVGDTGKPLPRGAVIGDTGSVKKGNVRPDALRTLRGREVVLDQYNPSARSASYSTKVENKWNNTLIDAAIDEAKANNDGMNLAIFTDMKRRGVKNFSKADLEGMNMYLFGEADPIKLHYGNDQVPGKQQQLPVSSELNWRKAYDDLRFGKTADAKANTLHEKQGILRGIADISEHDQELNDVLDRVEALRKTGYRGENVSITWAVKENPHASPATKKRAEALYEAITAPNENVPKTKTVKKYDQTLNLQNKEDAEYLTRILGENNVKQLQAGNFSHFRNPENTIRYWEDLAKRNIVSETPQTVAQQLRGRISLFNLKNRTVYHGTDAQIAPQILKEGFKNGADLPDGAYRGGGYDAKQQSISFSTDPRIAANFSTGANGSVLEATLDPRAKVATIKGVEYAEDLNPLIDELRKRGVDAVYLDGEKEVAVINKNVVRATGNIKNFRTIDAKNTDFSFRTQPETTSISSANPTIEHAKKLWAAGLNKGDYEQLLMDGNEKALKVFDKARQQLAERAAVGAMPKATARPVEPTRANPPILAPVVRPSVADDPFAAWAEQEFGKPQAPSTVAPINPNKVREEIAALEDIAQSNPARELARYANRNGELPEVLGKGGKFSTTGDGLAKELGFPDSEAARDAFGEYRQIVNRINELKSQLRSHRASLKDVPFGGYLEAPKTEAPLLLGPGRAQTPREAKRVFKKTGEAVPFVNQLKSNDKPLIFSETGQSKQLKIKGREITKKVKLELDPHIPRTTTRGVRAPRLNLATWKDKHVFALNRETMERNLENVAGADAPQVKEFLTDPIRANETKRAQFTNNERGEIRDYIVDKLGIHAGSAEDALIQRYGEGNMTVADLKKAAPQKWQQITAAAGYFRRKYDAILSQVNAERRRFGYAPIPKRQDYFRHFQEMDDAITNFGLILKPEELPTEIAGQTAIFKPGKPFSTAELQRKGGAYTESAIKGFDNYLDSISSQIYHLESVQRTRALEQYIRQAAGAGDVNLPNFVANLTDYGNMLAGKKSMIDRAAEGLLGRDVFKWANRLQRRLGKNMILGNVSSALTNFLPITQAAATTKKVALVQGIMDTIGSINGPYHTVDGQQSGFLIRRFRDDVIDPNGWQRAESAAGWVFKTIDQFTSKAIVASKYRELLGDGLSPRQAMQGADDYAVRIIADRSLGQLPNIGSVKSIGFITQFQTEVNNGVSVLIHDLPQLAKGNKAQLASMVAQLFIYSYVANNLYEKWTGRRPALDPIYAGLTALGRTESGKNKPLLKRLTVATTDVAGNLPYVGGITGGRYPISSAVPDMVGLAKGETTLTKELKKPAYMILPRFGGNQLKKTIEGMSAYTKGASVTDKGQIRFPIAQTPGNFARTALFGQYAVPESRSYFSQEQTPLGKDQSNLVMTAPTNERAGLIRLVRQSQEVKRQTTTQRAAEEAAVTKYLQTGDQSGLNQIPADRLRDYLGAAYKKQQAAHTTPTQQLLSNLSKNELIQLGQKGNYGQDVATALASKGTGTSSDATAKAVSAALTGNQVAFSQSFSQLTSKQMASVINSLENYGFNTIGLQAMQDAKVALDKTVKKINTKKKAKKGKKFKAPKFKAPELKLPKANKKSLKIKIPKTPKFKLKA